MLQNLILVINLCFYSLYAQNFTEDYKASLKAFASPCSFDWIQKTGTDSSITHYEISEKCYYAKSKNFEILANQDLQILVLFSEKKIIVTQNKQSTNDFQLLDTLLTYSQLTVKEHKSLPESEYYVVSYSNSKFKQVEFWFEKQSKRMIKSKATFNSNEDFTLESRLTNFTNQINPEKQKTDYYIKKSGDKYLPSTHFQQFKINSTSL